MKRRLGCECPAGLGPACVNCLLEAAKKRGPLSAEERRAQSISWCAGEIGIDHPELSADECRRRAEAAYAAVHPSGELSMTNHTYDLDAINARRLQKDRRPLTIKEARAAAAQHNGDNSIIEFLIGYTTGVPLSAAGMVGAALHAENTLSMAGTVLKPGAINFVPGATDNGGNAEKVQMADDYFRTPDSQPEFDRAGTLGLPPADVTPSPAYEPSAPSDMGGSTSSSSSD